MTYYAYRYNRKQGKECWDEVDGDETSPIRRIPNAQIFRYWMKSECYIIERSSGLALGGGDSYAKARRNMQERFRENRYGYSRQAFAKQLQANAAVNSLPPDMSEADFEAYLESIRSES